MEWIVWVLLGLLGLAFVVLGIVLQLNHTRKQGYDAGYHAGDNDGYKRGYDEGYDEGYDVGYSDAKNGNAHQWQN